MKEIEINYADSYDIWARYIGKALDKRHIAYTARMINRIQRSLIHKVNIYLTDNGYKPREHISYRKNLIYRLSREGLKLSIKSNRILWKYLEYFLDVDDYSPCFDVEIVVDDIAKASKDTIFVSVKDGINNAKEALFNADKQRINKETLDLVKQLNEIEKDEKIDLILKVLYNMIEEEE